MIHRLQRGALFVAELATERRIDLVVADQAIGHLREVGFGERRRLLHAAMAGAAGIAAVEMAAYVAGRRKISFRIDCGADYRSDVAERQVLLVIEACEQRRS